MTERGRPAVTRERLALAIGPSSLRWEGDALRIRIDELAVPWPARLRGELRVHPQMQVGRRFALDAAGRHHWQPIAPRARVELHLDAPELRWHGHGYLDSNRGDEPLEAGFKHWQWSRADLSGGRSAVLYEAQSRRAGATGLALEFGRDGAVQTFEPPASAALPRTGWRIDRATRSDPAVPARVQRTLEDTPFYARSLVHAGWLGEPVTAMHESLSLDRFAQPVVQAMLPFRMPRRRG
jgi:carotenoid 1,2-hydratase